MKFNKNGNTLTVVLVTLIVVSIISMLISYSVAFNARIVMKESYCIYEEIIFENTAYDIVNDYYESLESGKTFDEFKTEVVNKYEGFQIQINKILDNLVVIINEIDKEKAFNITFKLYDNSYVVINKGVYN